MLLKDTEAMVQEKFGFRAGNQDCRADKELQRPEFAVADNILQRLSLATPLKEFLETAFCFLLNRLVMQEKKLAAGYIPKAMAKEKFCFQGAVFKANLGERTGCSCQ
jgi:hypothetical protein